MQQLLRTGKMNQLSGQRNDLRDDGSPCRSLDPPTETEDKKRIQYTVDHHRRQRRIANLGKPEERNTAFSPRYI